MQQMLDYESEARNWHPWFAWYPLMINGRSVWLRTVLRRLEYCEIDGVPEQYWVYQVSEAGRGG